MSKFEEVRKLALSDSELFFSNRALAAKLVFQVQSAIEEYLEPESPESISVVGSSDDSTLEPLTKLKPLENGLVSKDPIKYNEFQCGVRFDFTSHANTQTSVFYLNVFVAQKRCQIFGETFDISNGEGIGECAFMYLKKSYDPEREQPVIGFI